MSELKEAGRVVILHHIGEDSHDVYAYDSYEAACFGARKIAETAWFQFDIDSNLLRGMDDEEIVEKWDELTSQKERFEIESTEILTLKE